MYRVVQIGDKEYPMLSMASVDIYYKRVFGVDPFRLQTSKDFGEGELVDMLERFAFIMNRFAECKSREEMNKLTEDSYIEWLDQIDRADLLDVLGEVKEVYEGQKKTTSTEKKEVAK